MDLEQLKEEVRQIADIANSVPEQFRDKCFELLLNHLVGNANNIKKGSQADSKDPVNETNEDDAVQREPGSPSAGSSIPLKAQLRVLMRKTGVTKEELEKVLMYDGEGEGAVHFVREPQNIAVAVGQIEWALLLALKGAVLKDSLSVDPEDARSICQEKGFYDAKNFSAIFKREANAGLFKGPMVSQGVAQSLSNEGQDALGKLIKRLASVVQ